jgi:hypothetical protein
MTAPITGNAELAAAAGDGVEVADAVADDVRVMVTLGVENGDGSNPVV